MMLRGCAIAAVLIGFAGFTHAERPFKFPLSAPSEMKETIPGQVLVKFRQDLAQQIATSPVMRMGAADGRLRSATFVNRIADTGWTLWRIDPETDSKLFAKGLFGAPGVVFAQPVNRIYPLLGTPNDGDYGIMETDDGVMFGNDPIFFRMWHLQDTFLLNQQGGALGGFSIFPNTWFTAANRPKKGRRIGFIDTGADMDHPDFMTAGATSTDYNFGGQLDHANSHMWRFGEIDPVEGPMDEHGHGTHVMGLAMAAGNNGSYAGHGIIGSGYMTVGSMQRVFDDEGVGTDTDAASAIFYLANIGTDVINISLGTENYSQIFQDAVTYATQKGSLVVCAGNEDGAGGGDLGPMYPAACSGALGVTANGPDLIPAVGTYSGSGYYVDVAAPGGDLVVIYDEEFPIFYIQFVWSTSARYPVAATDIPNLIPPYTENYSYLAGTSMACPIVAGAAATYMERFRLAQKSAWGNIRTYQAIQRSAIGAGAPNGGWETMQGFGSLDGEELMLDRNSRNALIGGVEGMVYIDGLATPNVQVKAQKNVVTNPMPPIFSTTTKADGSFRFDGMPEAEYKVWTQGGAPTKQRIVKLRNGCDLPGIDFWLGTFTFDVTAPDVRLQMTSPNLSTTQLVVNSFAGDTETGVMKMTFRFGTSPGSGNIISEREWMIGDGQHILTGLNLNPTTVYFGTFVATNGEGMTRTVVLKHRVSPTG